MCLRNFSLWTTSSGSRSACETSAEALRIPFTAISNEKCPALSSEALPGDAGLVRRQENLVDDMDDAVRRADVCSDNLGARNRDAIAAVNCKRAALQRRR